MSLIDDVILKFDKEWDSSINLRELLKKGESIRPDEIWSEYVAFKKPASNVGYHWNWRIPLHSIWPLYETVYCSIPFYEYYISDEIDDHLEDEVAFRRFFGMCPTDFIKLVEMGRIIPITDHPIKAYSKFMLENLIVPLISRNLPCLSYGVHTMIANTWQFMFDFFPDPKQRSSWGFLMDLVSASCIDATYIRTKPELEGFEIILNYLKKTNKISDWPMLLENEMSIKHILENIGVYYNADFTLDDYISNLDDETSKALKIVTSSIISAPEEGNTFLSRLKDYNEQLQRIEKSKIVKGILVTGDLIENNCGAVICSALSAILAAEMQVLSPGIAALLGASTGKLFDKGMKLPEEITRTLDTALINVGNKFVPLLSKFLKVSPEIIHLFDLKSELKKLGKISK